ncbi:FtsX-like permease family protein [Alkalimarinus coralli]|uniref:FtsX-like permease family protein n=1 Tax=Alkalimarinus coralli TaxID=2935863 RepID=UPI00202B4A68|nr:FtsX-like permease family protein [Alkalimarinus coralli]
MRILWLTLRNLLKNRRRTLITLSSVIVGCASLIFVWGFIDGINSQMIDNSTGYVSGHIKIHRLGYHDTKELNIAIDQQSPIASLLDQQKGIAGFSPRLEGYALASVGEKSRMMQVAGVSPDAEPSVTQIKQAIIEGRYLQTDATNEVVLGDDALMAFNAGVGDEIVLITQAADGSIGADRFRVVGSFNTGIEIMDRNLAYISLAGAQELFSLWGRVSAWSIRLEDRSQVDMITAVISGQLADQYEVLSWQEMMPSLLQMVQFHEAVAYVVLFVVFTVVTAGIANTILMSVMERTREFGVMMALGTQRYQVLMLVLSESVVLGILGVALGSILGVAINQYLAETGMDLGQFTQAMETMPGLSGMVYPVTDMGHVWLVNAVVLIVAILPALYPAWRASRLQPVTAIRGLHPQGWTGLRSRTDKPSQSQWVFWQIAFRSMFRNPRRSMLTAGATAFGLAAYWFLYAFADGFFEQMIENSTGQMSGHLQVSASEFRQDYSPSLRIGDTDSLVAKVAQSAEVKAVAPRVIVKGMLASARKSWPVELSGIVAPKEKQVTTLFKQMSQGQYVNPAVPEGMVIGQKIAEELSVEVGDKVVVTIQQAGGDLASAAYTVSGVFDTGSEVFDGGYAFVNFDSLHRLLAFKPGESSVVAVRLQSRFISQEFARQLAQQVDGSKLLVLPWEQVMPIVVQMVDLTQIDFYLILVVFIVVAMGVMNTMLMSVLERTREFGVMMALGTEGHQVIRLVLYEAIVLGLVGMVVGAMLGTAITAYYAHFGIDLSGLSKSMQTIPGMTDIIYPVLILQHIWLPSLLLFVCGVTVSIYPAIKASRLNPVEAIRHA